METKTYKCQVTGIDYRNGSKGKFMVANFKYTRDGKETELKSRAIFDKVDEVTVKQAYDNKEELMVEFEKTEPDEDGKYFINVKSVKRLGDAPQAEKKPSNAVPLSKDEQIEKSVWVKELGEGIRTGLIKNDNPLYIWYFAKMSIILDEP